ncbi:MAG: FAD:protein FMN transferase [Candidatus Azobacteroides sp.]|nr:FAD:protein FMN transferase [Candidatus Azobacteroides sp.]
MNIKKYGQWQRFFFILAFCLIFSACKKENSYYKTSGEVFKTSFHIQYKHNRLLDKEIRECFDQFDLSLNPFNRESIIYKVNNNEPVEADDWFIAVFNKAMEISEISEGTYDITCSPFINLWGFGFQRVDKGTNLQHTIDSLKQFVGYRKVRLEGRKVIKDDKRLQLNASSIAKGYACDVIAKLLESQGITDYLVEIGGEIHAKGKNPSGRCWRIEISKPIDDASGQMNERMEVVELCDKSLATSGNYRNFYVKDGKKYAHTINAVTGYPAESDILSASVICSDCMTADAFATAFMTKTVDNAVILGDRIPGLDYLFIYTDENGNLLEKESLNMDKYLIK